jgi:magnesium chelatase family protein
MLARRLPSILPPLSPDEALETTKIWSVAGLLDPESPLIEHTPFRAPHHTITAVSLAGGGAVPRPGEISLAHNGVLFLDELPEFTGRVLDVLRQPLEEGRVMIVRNTRAVSFPARFMLVAAMNPCPCGFHGHPERECACTWLQVKRYRSRISGPFLDRIDLHVEVPPVEVEALDRGRGESSLTVAARVAGARARTAGRLEALPSESISPGAAGINAALTPAGLRRLPGPEAEARRMLARAVRSYGLSARTYHRLLKVAWTIADLAGAERVTAGHIGEALQFRVGERDRDALSHAPAVGRRIY